MPVIDSGLPPLPPGLPPRLRDRMRRARWTARTGWSDALTYALDLAGGARLFVKIEPDGLSDETAAEAARLAWLRTTPIACPHTLFAGASGTAYWLVTRALPGRDLDAGIDARPDDVIRVAAEALRALHALDPATCPFDHRIDARIAAARDRIDAGLVDLDDFDAQHHGLDVEAVFAAMLAQRPAIEEPVVAHGDAGLGNILMADGRFSGFVDVGRLGIADRHQDLALIARDIGDDMGPAALEAFLATYGGPVDPQRMAFFRLLDEFF